MRWIFIWRLLAPLALVACSTRSCHEPADAAPIESAERAIKGFRCGADQAPKPQAERDTRMVATIDRALEFFEGSRDPYALIMLDVLRRRFGVASFDDALSRYDELVREDPRRDPMLRVFRRIVDHDNKLQPGDDAAVTLLVDQLTVPALYCDRTPPPSNYGALLDAANGSGGYLRTHALLSLQWLRENGCAMPAAADYEKALLDGVAGLIVDDGAASDLELEAAGFLYAYGRGDMVHPTFVDEVMAQQNDDGGWLVGVSEQRGSDWHASIIATYLLLHAYCGERAYPPMLAPAP